MSRSTLARPPRPPRPPRPARRRAPRPPHGGPLSRVVPSTDAPTSTYIPRWQPHGRRDRARARLVRALRGHRDAVLARDPWLPVPNDGAVFTFGEERRPLPAGALLHLWDVCAYTVGDCPKCSGLALADGFGRAGATGSIEGVCTECGQRVRRTLDAMTPVGVVIAPYLERTAYWVSGIGAPLPSTGLGEELQTVLDSLQSRTGRHSRGTRATRARPSARPSSRSSPSASP